MILLIYAPSSEQPSWLKDTIDRYYSPLVDGALGDITSIFDAMPVSQPAVYGKLYNANFPSENVWKKLTLNHEFVTTQNEGVRLTPGNNAIAPIDGSSKIQLKKGKYEISLDLFIKYRHDIGMV